MPGQRLLIQHRRQEAVMYNNRRHRDKDQKQLGMNIAVAQRKLVRMLLFRELVLTERNICFRCKQEIETLKELSLDHIQPWRSQANPVESFFSVDNVAYSHVSCNKKVPKRHRNVDSDVAAL